MSASPLPVPEFDVLKQAADWFALLRSEAATAADRDRWQAWLAERGEHRDAWRYVENVSQRFAPLGGDDRKDAATRALSAAHAPRRRAIGAAMLLLGSGAAAWGFLRRDELQAMASAATADHRTAVGEIRDLVLADGSKVWLNTDTAMDADMRVDLRRIRLHRGELLVETARDAARPFFVQTSHGRMQALGTRFTVRRDDEFTYLAVYEGAVEVHVADADAKTVVDAGHQVTFTRTAIGPRQPADRARQSWTRGVLLAENIPLGELANELSRYQRGHLGVAPEVAQLRVMGTFPLRDPARVYAMLEQALPVRVQRPFSWWTTIEARPGT